MLLSWSLPVAAQQMADTGWAVGNPPTLGHEVKTDDLKAQLRVAQLRSKDNPADSPGADTDKEVVWRPSRDPVSEQPQPGDATFDWALSTLSDFSLQLKRSIASPEKAPEESPEAPAPDTRESGPRIEPPAAEDNRSAEDETIEFRSPRLLVPHRTEDAKPIEAAENDDLDVSDEDIAVPTDKSLNPSTDNYIDRRRDLPSNAPPQGKQKQTPADSARPAEDDRETGALDSSELDRLLESWGSGGRPNGPRRPAASQGRSPSPESPQRKPARVTEPEASSPISMPDEPRKLQRVPRQSAPSAEQSREPPQQEPSPETTHQDRSEQRRSPPESRPEPSHAKDKESGAKPDRKPLRPLSRNEKRLRNKIRGILKAYYRRPLNSRDHDPWEMMHGMLSYGVHSRVLQHGPGGDPVTAVGWLCYNKPCKRKTLLYTTPEGELRARWGVGVQGHYGQFLAMLAQCRVARNYPIRVEGKEFTIDDLIEAEKVTCHSGEELTFKLISLMHYCPSDAQWVNEQGARWDIRRLIREELEQPIRGAPCGGTHRLAGLSLAARTRVKRGEPLDGEFKEAHEFSQRYQRYAFRFQNRDGSMSTNWFRGSGDEEDINRRIKTTGHILEWLLYSMEDDELRDPRIFRAVNYLANLLQSNYRHDWEIGPLCHATHALVIYDERMYQKYDGLEETDENVARSNQRRQATSPNSRRSRSR